MPITPFIGVRISWLMLARNCDLASVAARAFSDCCLSSWLIAVSCCVRSLTCAVARERAVAHLDLVEHFVERLDQEADLVVGGHARADRVVAGERDAPRDLRQVLERAGDDALHARGEQVRDRQATEQDAHSDQREAHQPVGDETHVRVQVDHAGRLAVELDRMPDLDRREFERVALELRLVGRRLDPGALERGERFAVGRVDARGEDVLLGVELRQRLGREIRVLELERRARVDPEHVGEHLEIAHLLLARLRPVVQTEQGAREHQPDAGDEHQQARQLAADRRLVDQGRHQCSPWSSLTMRASFNSCELRSSVARLVASVLISKRIFLSSM
jgi:hypothetical protein